MPIYFRNAPVREPFIYDSIGNHWLQDATSRPNGYPFYHYLQTESGCGRITIQGKSYLLHEQEGVLIAPLHPTLLSGPDSGVVHLLLYLFRNSRRQYFQNPEQPADSFLPQKSNVGIYARCCRMPYSFSNILRSTSRYSPSTVIRCFYSFRMSRTVRSFFLIRCICAMLLRSSKK